MPKTISIKGRTFAFVGGQRSGAAIYRSDDRGRRCFMRIGPKDVIANDLALHKSMEAKKYPVAHLISEGEHGTQAYFLEKQLKGNSFRNRFARNWTEFHRAHPVAFSEMTNLVEALLDAQVHSSEGTWTRDDLAHAIRLSELIAEYPRDGRRLSHRFDKAYRALKDFPACITHGDCNPSNMYLSGIIDLEDSFIGPIGYDAATSLMNADWLPLSGEYEFIAPFAFDHSQKLSFINRIDRFFAKNRLPSFKSAYQEFVFCRAVWLCAGMAEWPKTALWRMEKLRAEFLTD